MKRKNSVREDSPTKRMKMNNDEITDATEIMDLLSLPVDIHAIIFLKVHTNDAGRSRRVCKYLKEVLDNIPDLRWAILFQSNFGLPELARPPGGLLWRKQYKYSVSVLKNLASVDDIYRTREIASDITDLEAEQFKFSDLAETLLKMPENDRKKLIEAKSTWAIRVSYYRLTYNLIRHGIFHFNPMFFTITLQQGYEEVLNVLWNEKMYDNNSLDRCLPLALGRGSDWHHWAKRFIEAGAKGDSYVFRALLEDDANLLEKLLKVGVPPGDLQLARSKETLKLLLDYGAVDSFQAVNGSIFSFRRRAAPESMFVSLIENGNYDMAEMLLLSGKAKGIERGLEIAQQKNSKFEEVILKYLQQ